MPDGRRIRRRPAGAGLVARARLIRYQPRRRNRIPGGITPEHFLQITRILGRILQELDRAVGGRRARNRPRELHIRLNESDKPYPFPIFAGWVEADDARETRQAWNHPDPGLYRFGDDVYSEIYGEAFRYANHQDREQHFRFRDWERGELLEKRAGEKATDPKAGNRFQTCLAIVARVGGQLRTVGTLVVGFRRKPSDKSLATTQRILREFARQPDTTDRRSVLLRFLGRNFDLGGPPLEKSDWLASLSTADP